MATGLHGTLVHLNHGDVTLICFSRAPIERLTAYKQRMGWQFPYVSTYNTDFAFDFGLAMTTEQAEQVPEVQQMLADPPQWNTMTAPDPFVAPYYFFLLERTPKPRSDEFRAWRKDEHPD